MVFALTGIAVSDEIVLGPAHILHRATPSITKVTLEHNDVTREIARFHRALECAVQQLNHIRQQVAYHATQEVTAFIDSHLLMLTDDTVAQAPAQLIQAQRCNAEWALRQQRDALMQAFDEMEDEYLRERRHDVDQVVDRIMRALRQQDPSKKTPTPKKQRYIVATEDISPADLLALHHEGACGLITEQGSPLSHTAILARNLGIPMLLGTKVATRYLQEGENIILDCPHRTVWSNTDKAAHKHYRQQIRIGASRKKAQHVLRHQSARTKDGSTITLRANAEFPTEVPAARHVGAEGIGLYRTEFLVLDRGHIPDEETQYQHYCEALKGLAGLPLTLRTFDLGADKALEPSAGDNPALGLRGIRHCLNNLDLFVPQLRAALRASAHGPLRLLIPMVTSGREMQQIRQLIDDTHQQLAREQQSVADSIPLGAMIETPAAAMGIDSLARHADFFAIGTNDLLQYALAIDRNADNVRYIYDPLHPGFLALLQHIVRRSQALGKPTSLCGQMASEPQFTRLLLGLGLRELSLPANALLAVKQQVLQTHLASLAPTVDRLLQAPDAESAQRILQQLNEIT